MLKRGNGLIQVMFCHRQAVNKKRYQTEKENREKTRGLGVGELGLGGHNLMDGITSMLGHGLLERLAHVHAET